MSKPETRRQRNIQKLLRKRYPGIWLFKSHGSEYQPAGLPDLIGCLNGRLFGLEVKEPGEEPSAIQDEEIADIKAAGGIAGRIETIEEAIALLEPPRKNQDLPRLLRAMASSSHAKENHHNIILLAAANELEK